MLVGIMQWDPKYEESKLKVLQGLWKWKGIIPKIRTFLWRALQGGLATTHELSRRIRRIQPACPRCGLENEYTMHMLFFCPASRAIWFASRISLRVGELPMNFEETLLKMTAILDETQMAYFCNVLWMLWKVRNDEIFNGKKPNIREVLAKLLLVTSGEQEQQQRPRDLLVVEAVNIPTNGRVILVDGSWDKVHGSGKSMSVYNRRGDLVYIQYDKGEEFDPFHTETEAMLMAIQYALEARCEGTFYIFTDCQLLIKAIQEGDITKIPSWRAAESVVKCINGHQINPSRILVQHIKREAVKTSHNMANWARKTGRSGKGTPLQCFLPQTEIEHNLNRVFFRLEGEAGERERMGRAGLAAVAGCRSNLVQK
ncbi:uncharacterized protein LOC144558181 [Carex rostrata]